MSNYFPILLDLKNKECLIVGGGKVAFRRANKLLLANAKVTIISPTLHTSFDKIINRSSITWISSYYSSKYKTRKYSLVFAATNDHSLNLQIKNDFNSIGSFVNVASLKEECDFIVPATITQGDLNINITTSGKVPGLSKAIKENLEKEFNNDYNNLINILSHLRHKVDYNVLDKITKDYMYVLYLISKKYSSNEIIDILLSKHN